jgi:hypothetical protein
MKSIAAIAKTVLGLFIDDSSLAIAIVALLAGLAALAHSGLIGSPLVAMLVLVGGTVLLLLENVIRTAARRGS